VLNKVYSKLCIVKYFYANFPIQNGLQQEEHNRNYPVRDYEIGRACSMNGEDEYV
jgi:hypothetical protein